MTGPVALEAIGWSAGFAAAFAPHEVVGRVPARVVAEERGQFLVHDGTATHAATVSGRFRYESGGDPLAYPTVGDWVAATTAVGGGTATIHGLLPRRSAIVRRAPADHGTGAQVLAANVDIVFIVTSLNAELNLRRLERYLAVAWESGALPDRRPLEGRPRRRRRRPPRRGRIRGARRRGDRRVGGQRRRDRGGPGPPRPRPDGRLHRVVGRRQVHPRQRARRPRAPDHRRHSRGRRPRPAHDDAPPARRRSPTAWSSTPRACASSASSTARAWRAPSTTSSGPPSGCRFRDCRHESEPGCAVRAALAARRPGPGPIPGLPEAGAGGPPQPSSPNDAVARKAERRKWTAMIKGVERHMEQKYGGGAMTVEREQPAVVRPAGRTPPIAGPRRSATWTVERDYPAIAELICDRERQRRRRLAARADETPDTSGSTDDGFDLDEDVLLAEVDGVARRLRPARLAPARREASSTSSGPLVHPGLAAPRARPGAPRLGRGIVRPGASETGTIGPARRCPHVLAGWADLEIADVTPFAAAAGYHVEAYGVMMTRSLAEPIPERRAPQGLEVRPVRPEDHRRIWDADAEAFRGPPRSRASGPRRTSIAGSPQPDLDTSLWQVAWDGDEVAGSVAELHLPARERAARDQARLARAHLRPAPWRRRGFASALICRSLRRFRDLGLDEAALGADAENLTGAVRLYEAPWLPPGPDRRQLPQADGRAAGGPIELAVWTPALRAAGGAARATSSSHGRSRPIVVSGPWPGRTASGSSKVASRAERLDHLLRRAARQVHPPPPAGEERVAAEQQAVVGRPEADRALRVAGRVEDREADLAEPDLAALREVDRGDAGRDLERRPERLRVREPVGVQRVDRDRGAGVRRRRAAFSPKWSQWPWVVTMSFSVQPRSASSSEIQASDGIAVSIAMASRVRASASRWTFVRAGPTTRVRRSNQPSATIFARMQSKVWPIILLAVPSTIRAPTLASIPLRLTSAAQSIVVVPGSGPSTRFIRPRASTALPGAWPWALMIAMSGACWSAISRSTTKRAVMNPTPTFAFARKCVASMTSMDSTPGPQAPTLFGSVTNAKTRVARGGDVDGARELHQRPPVVAGEAAPVRPVTPRGMQARMIPTPRRTRPDRG